MLLVSGKQDLEWKATYPVGEPELTEVTVRETEEPLLALEEPAEEEVPVEPVLALMSNCWD